MSGHGKTLCNWNGRRVYSRPFANVVRIADLFGTSGTLWATSAKWTNRAEFGSAVVRVDQFPAFASRRGQQAPEFLDDICQLLSVIPTAAELPHQGFLALNATLPQIVEDVEHRTIDVYGCPGPCRKRDAAEVLATQTHTIRDAKERA